MYDRDYLRNVAMGLVPTPFNRARDTEDDQRQELCPEIADAIHVAIDDALLHMFGRYWDDCWSTAKVVVAARFVGAHVGLITQITGFSREFVQGVGANLRKNGLWQRTRVRYEAWSSVGQGYSRFRRDLCVALGGSLSIPKDTAA